MADKTLGQVAYEAWWDAIDYEYAAGGRSIDPPKDGWSRLRPQTRAAWEAAATAALEACGGSGCRSPHGPDYRCFDCATDDEMAAAIPPPPGDGHG